MTSQIRRTAAVVTSALVASFWNPAAAHASAKPENFCTIVPVSVASAALKTPVKSREKTVSGACRWLSTPHQDVTTRELAVGELHVPMLPVEWIQASDAQAQAHFALIVPGIGDRAYWSADTDGPSDGFRLNLLKGDRIFSILVRGQSETDSLAAAELTARELLRHLSFTASSI